MCMLQKMFFFWVKYKNILKAQERMQQCTRIMYKKSALKQNERWVGCEKFSSDE